MQSDMIRTGRPRRLTCSMVVGILLIGLPACQSPDYRRWGWAPQQQPADSTNVVYRPILSWLERPNPLYLSNYAGDDESPMRPRPTPAGAPVMAPVDATPAVTLQHGSWDGD